MSGEILFLAHRMPFPPDRGDKIRSSHVLKHLAALGPVHAATFAENEADLAQEPQLEVLCASHLLVRRRKPLPLAGAEALLRRQPVSLTAFHSPAIRAYVDKVLQERPIAAIYVFSGQMGQYVPDWFDGPVILDFVDVDSAKFDAYGASGSGPRAWIDAREGRLLAAEEARLARRARHSLFVSAEEAALFQSRLSGPDRNPCDIRALRNGIDCAVFDPASVAPELALTELPAPRLIFTGQMDYAPNIAAAERAITRLMPAIRAELPEASFHVVGRNPPAAMKALHRQNGCHVWGEVADIRTWLRGADIALVPLEIARGVQNKVLEAMAMELPVVLTSGAATGIGARDGEHLSIIDSDAELVGRVVELARDPGKATSLGHSARRYVADTLSWPATLAPLEALIFGSAQGQPRHAA
ncbi:MULTISPECIES: TIGR03087 family PEP-CTERM/XrtA system glycosyltransferase [unclassified Novosphingobium]|uniref:TIGR03087 family PEP-CTERM/XrtA system glycosyltransferase n=1 Tax=unclassified Novosphingobium TaxID=2644732 RepID=UPI0025F825A3|nr:MULTISPECIES: TIGR03087 family PEP-CTERM/XrtA system glycosyltransferase [unclassified Novosphingobium]HQV02602.1 TIGR03087 family PEP-CTERM/XrtA system glycosyltransferase [Novosphingobium sp.]